MTPPDLDIHVEPPPGWAQIQQEPDDDGSVLLTIAPQSWAEELGLRPNLVIGLGAPTQESVRAVATQTAATLLAMGPGHRMIAWDLWQDDAGRRLLSTWPSGDALVCTTTWLRLEGDRPLSLTATVDSDRYLRVMPLISACVDSLRVQRPPSPEAKNA